MKSVSSRRRQSRKHTSGDVETDESESDPDQLTSSRTESSNQLDAGKLKHSKPKYKVKDAQLESIFLLRVSFLLQFVRAV